MVFIGISSLFDIELMLPIEPLKLWELLEAVSAGVQLAMEHNEDLGGIDITGVESEFVLPLPGHLTPEHLLWLLDELDSSADKVLAIGGDA